MSKLIVITTTAEEDLLIAQGWITVPDETVNRRDLFTWDCSINGCIVEVDGDCDIGHSLEDWMQGE